MIGDWINSIIHLNKLEWIESFDQLMDWLTDYKNSLTVRGSHNEHVTADDVIVNCERGLCISAASWPLDHGRFIAPFGPFSAV